jgi:hypothetical protein
MAGLLPESWTVQRCAMNLFDHGCRESMTRMFSFISTIRQKCMILRDPWGYESFPFISILHNSLQSRLVEADSMKPPQYVARRFQIKFSRRRHEYSCPNNSPIDVFRLFHEILVWWLTPMPIINMDLQGKRMTHHGTQNIRSLDNLLSRLTGSRVQSMGMMDYLVDVMSLQGAAIADREEVYVQTPPFLFPPSGR